MDFGLWTCIRYQFTSIFLTYNIADTYKINNLDNSFFKNNKGDQVFWVKGNEILSPANIGMPQGRKEELDLYFGKE